MYFHPKTSVYRATVNAIYPLTTTFIQGRQLSNDYNIKRSLCNLMVDYNLNRFIETNGTIFHRSNLNDDS